MASPLAPLRCGSMGKARSLLGINMRYLHTPSVKEVRIPSSCGDLAGKWWGDEKRQPILALHGWQDNAGTWDSLVPHLPPDYSILALDLPGHGQSSWIPKGMIYTDWLYVRCVQDVMRHYEWNTVSFLGHSMGSNISFLYASIFPENVNFFISLENIIPDITDRMEKRFEIVRKNLVNMYVDEIHQDTEPPAYPYEEVLMKWHLGTMKHVALETAHYLVDRGTNKSIFNPNKYYFSRDPKLKNNDYFTPPHQEFTKYGITRLQFPMLYIKANDSNYATGELAISCRELLAQTNNRYEFRCVPGNHYVHLNNPEIVAPIITQFLNKYTMTVKQETLAAVNCKL